MVRESEHLCPLCGGELKYLGHVRRIMKTGSGYSKWIEVRRLRCTECGTIHRELPNSLLPYKHYSTNIINRVVSGEITPDILEYEDYPCELTMKHWTEEFTKDN